MSVYDYSEPNSLGSIWILHSREFRTNRSWVSIGQTTYDEILSLSRASYIYTNKYFGNFVVSYSLLLCPGMQNVHQTARLH